MITLQYFTAVVDSFTLSVTVWCDNTTAYDRKQLERAFHTASKAWAVIVYVWPLTTPHNISHKREKVEVLRLPANFSQTVWEIKGF